MSALAPIFSVVNTELEAVETQLKSLTSEVALVRQVVDYVLRQGGKRLRPVVLLLSAKACDYRGVDAINLAAVIEYIHTATLLHDDVVDTSTLRRGVATSHTRWNNATSILVGDFLYSRAFQWMVASENLSFLELFASGTNCIAAAETQQLMNRHKLDIPLDDYLAILEKKTGKLFEIAAVLGAMLGEQPHTIQQQLSAFGKHLGIAFQLVDDVLDYHGDTESIGKNIGDDLAKGCATLPVLYAYWHGNESQRALIYHVIHRGDLTQMDEIVAIITTTGALEHTMQLAQNAANSAIDCLTCLPASEAKTALTKLTQFAVNRIS